MGSEREYESRARSNHGIMLVNTEIRSNEIPGTANCECNIVLWKIVINCNHYRGVCGRE